MPRFIILSEPRTGSTYFQSLLKLHFDVDCKEDLLSDECEPRDDPIGQVDRQLSALSKPVVGFKTFPEHLVYHQLSLVELVRRLDVRWLIVLWRENFLEMYVSLQIALRTNVWYSSKPTSQVETVDVNGEELLKYLAETEERWKQVVEGWPPDVVPIFVKYEDLVKNAATEMSRILQCMSLDPTDYVFEAECCRQNSASLSHKVTTWNELSPEERNATLDIPSIVNEAINYQLNVRSEFSHLLPDREPPPPPAGWIYRVAEPYITSVSRENVIDAIDSGSVSSAGRWPQEMSRKLREIFGTAVAQPCSNGFCAIVLALRAARVGPGDDVLLPTFTMIAVPNAVRIVGARPVLVDNAPGTYNPSIREIEEAATRQMKAVIVTHTYGVPTAGMESIAELCRQRGWFLIEDISESAGIVTTTADGNRRLLGMFGDFACASMYANKLLQGGDGGFVLAKDAMHRYRLGSLVNHGFTRSYHFVHLEEAPNFKISGLAAALACGNLDLVDEIVGHRNVLARTYRRCLQSTPLQLMPPCGPDDTPWVLGVCCVDKAQRRSLRELLAQHGAETRNYFFPIHAQPAYRDQITCNAASFPNADHCAETGFYLPTYTSLTEKDVEWICSVVVSYFTEQRSILQCPKSPSLSNSIRVDSKTLVMESRGLDDDGKLVERCIGQCNHYSTTAVSLRSQAGRYLFYERWDRGQILLRQMQECIKESRENGFDVAEHVLQPFVDYILSQEKYELEIQEPWTNVDFTKGDLSICRSIPTTAEPELLQLLYWLVQRVQGVPYILELGSLFGASTAVLAVAARQQSPDSRVVAVDTFTWQSWMNKYLVGVKHEIDESFLDIFQKHTSFVSDVIKVIQCDIGSDQFEADTFNGLAFDIVFFDFTRDLDEMEMAWTRVKPHLKDGISVVVVNSLTINTIPFLTIHSRELVPIAKPQGTTAKAYRYMNPAEITDEVRELTFSRRFRFLQSPDWSHHQGQAFNVAIDALIEQLHSPDSEVDFIPAVEEFICDFRHQILRPWVGIIHGVPEDDQFYPPDMKRLCSKRYRTVMKLCRGLFTLTRVQTEYLQKHLNIGRRIPICTLRLPMLPPSTIKSSDVVSRWTQNGSVDLVFIGSFARDFPFFFRVQVPPGIRKVLLVGDEASREWATKSPQDVVVYSRLDAKDYEQMLCRSIVMLALRYNGAANTIILECIARHIPIAAPRIDSCIDYLGKGYPLLYDQGCHDMTDILTMSKVQKSIDYLTNIDKSIFSISQFYETIKSSSVLLNLAPEIPSDELQHLSVRFDVTVCICSYKRTNNVDSILKSLLLNQNFSGTIQVIVWNNNEARVKVVRQICEPYLKRSSSRRSLELISSTSNHYCIIRACMLHLMRSDLLLICDDDVIPRETYVQFFVEAHYRHTKDILAVRGHRFLFHQLNHVDPRAEWLNYKHLRFVDDDQPEQLVHFLHADICLIPAAALQDFVSVPMPDAGFILVDDYWMSFVLSHYFNRNLRKLQCCDHEHFERTAESDEAGLALYTRAEVQDAKIRMYIHHMLNGWPSWSSEPQIAEATTKGQTKLMEEKRKWWNGPAFIGYNVSSDITREDAVDLVKLGAKVVRIGAVGCREDTDFEFCGFLDDPTTEMEELRATVSMLAEFGIGVVITLHQRVVCAELWTLIASEFRHQANVIGYDLINEPHVDADSDCHFADVPNITVLELAEYFDTVTRYWQQIRAVDKVTPVIVEPTFWAKPCALSHLSDFISRIRASDPNILMSVHFYEPQLLVSRRLNNGRYGFPGTVPLFDCKYTEEELWDDERIGREIEKLRQWEISHEVKLFVGEFGISRNTAGAADYLRAVATACLSRNISCLVYSFRETTWDDRNYELGPHTSATITITRLPWNDNPLTKALLDVSQMRAAEHTPNE